MSLTDDQLVFPILFYLVEYRTPSWKPVPTVAWKTSKYQSEKSSWEKGTYLS